MTTLATLDALITSLVPFVPGTSEEARERILNMGRAEFLALPVALASRLAAGHWSANVGQSWSTCRVAHRSTRPTKRSRCSAPEPWFTIPTC